MKIVVETPSSTYMFKVTTPKFLIKFLGCEQLRLPAGLVNSIEFPKEQPVTFSYYPVDECGNIIKNEGPILVVTETPSKVDFRKD